jgi:hypothetical protein
MQKFFQLAAVAALCAASAAQAQMTLDANMELDTTFQNKVDAAATNTRESDLNLGGRVEFNVGGKATNGDAFVAARASLLLKKDGTSGVDDMWVQAGNSGADVKLGRFEAMDLFPVGKDTVLEYAGYTPYQANKLRGRMGSNVFHGALGLNAAPGLRIEVGLVSTKVAGQNKGVRTGLMYNAGDLTLRAGVESVKAVGAASSESGVGLSLGYKLNANTNVNVNYAKKEDDKTLGLNATMGAAGIGLVSGKGATAAQKATTVYAAYTLSLMGVKGASITPAVSFAKGGTGTDNQTAVRVRINYAF